MPRVERFAVGTRIDSLYLDLLELLRKATFAEPKNKIVLLEDSNIIIDSLRFFYQLAWEAKLVKDEQYTELAVMIEEVGRQVGAWKFGIIDKLNKTSPHGEERY